MKKIISLLLVAIFCFSFAGCTKKQIVNISDSPTLLANKNYGMLYGLDYGMSKNEVFSILGVKESNATEKDTNHSASSTYKDKYYVFENVVIKNISCNITLSFVNNNSNPTGLKDIGLSSIIVVMNDSDYTKVKSEIENSKFTKRTENVSPNDLYSTWTNKTTIKDFCVEEGVDYNKFISSYSKAFNLSETQVKSIYPPDYTMGHIGKVVLTDEHKIRLEFNAMDIAFIKSLK